MPRRSLKTADQSLGHFCNCFAATQCHKIRINKRQNNKPRVLQIFTKYHQIAIKVRAKRKQHPSNHEFKHKTLFKWGSAVVIAVENSLTCFDLTTHKLPNERQIRDLTSGDWMKKNTNNLAFKSKNFMGNQNEYLGDKFTLNRHATNNSNAAEKSLTEFYRKFAEISHFTTQHFNMEQFFNSKSTPTIQIEYTDVQDNIIVAAKQLTSSAIFESVTENANKLFIIYLECPEFKDETQNTISTHENALVRITLNFVGKSSNNMCKYLICQACSHLCICAQFINFVEVRDQNLYKLSSREHSKHEFISYEELYINVEHTYICMGGFKLPKHFIIENSNHHEDHFTLPQHLLFSQLHVFIRNSSSLLVFVSACIRIPTTHLLHEHKIIVCFAFSNTSYLMFKDLMKPQKLRSTQSSFLHDPCRAFIRTCFKNLTPFFYCKVLTTKMTKLSNSRLQVTNFKLLNVFLYQIQYKISKIINASLLLLAAQNSASMQYLLNTAFNFANLLTIGYFIHVSRIVLHCSMVACFMFKRIRLGSLTSQNILKFSIIPSKMISIRKLHLSKNFIGLKGGSRQKLADEIDSLPNRRRSQVDFQNEQENAKNECFINSNANSDIIDDLKLDVSISNSTNENMDTNIFDNQTMSHKNMQFDENAEKRSNNNEIACDHSLDIEMQKIEPQNDILAKEKTLEMFCSTPILSPKVVSTEVGLHPSQTKSKIAENEIDLSYNAIKHEETGFEGDSLSKNAESNSTENTQENSQKRVKRKYTRRKPVSKTSEAKKSLKNVEDVSEGILDSQEPRSKRKYTRKSRKQASDALFVDSNMRFESNVDKILHFYNKDLQNLQAFNFGKFKSEEHAIKNLMPFHVFHAGHDIYDAQLDFDEIEDLLKSVRVYCQRVAKNSNETIVIKKLQIEKMKYMEASAGVSASKSKNRQKKVVVKPVIDSRRRFITNLDPFFKIRLPYNTQELLKAHSTLAGNHFEEKLVQNNECEH